VTSQVVAFGNICAPPVAVNTATLTANDPGTWARLTP
jgi:hypothetical protein